MTSLLDGRKIKYVPVARTYPLVLIKTNHKWASEKKHNFCFSMCRLSTKKLKKERQT